MNKFIKWLDNYWYHYKWPTIIIAFFVGVFSICIVQMVNRNNYDVYVMYSGGELFSSEQEGAVTNVLGYVMDDYDKDGEKNVCLTKVIVLSEEELKAAQAAAQDEGTVLAYNYQSRTEAIQRFDMEIMTGQSYLCLLSESMYERAADSQRFVPLDSLFDTVPEAAYDGYAVRLLHTPLGEYFSEAMGVLGEDTLVCLRRISVTDAANKKATEDYENHMEMFVRLCEFEIEQ